MCIFVVCIDYEKNNYFTVSQTWECSFYSIFQMWAGKLAFCWVVSGPWHRAASPPMMEGAWPWEQVGPGLPREHEGPGLPLEEAETADAPSSPAGEVAGCTNSPCTNKSHDLATVLPTTVTKLLKFLEVRVHKMSTRAENGLIKLGYTIWFWRYFFYY